MNIVRPIIVALLVLVLALGAGCGGDDDDEEAATTGATTEETTPEETTRTDEDGEQRGGGTTRVVMDEYSFDPEDVTVERGASVSVVNEGGIAHNLTVERGPNARRKTAKLAGTSTFLGGRTERLRVNLDPGNYVMVCTVPGHRELGMTGDFTVR